MDLSLYPVQTYRKISWHDSGNLLKQSIIFFMDGLYQWKTLKKNFFLINFFAADIYVPHFPGVYL